MILLIAMLTGCSPAELGLANIMKDLSNEKMMKIEGEYEIELPEEMNFSFAGEIDTRDKTNPYVNLTVNFEYPGEKVSIQNAKFIIQDKSMYLSKNIVREILAVNETENYMKSFDSALTDIEYIEISFEEEGYDEIVDYYGMTDQIPKEELITEFKEIFKYFQTDFVKKENNLYVVEIDKYSIFQTVDRFMNFLSKYKENIYDTLTAAVLKNYDMLLVLSNGEIDDKETLTADFKEYRTEFIQEIEETVTRYKDFAREDFRKELNNLGDTKIKQTIIKRKDNAYILTQDFNIEYKNLVPSLDNTDVMRQVNRNFVLKGKTSISIPENIEKNTIFDALNIYDAQDTVDKTYNFNNPVKLVEIVWDEAKYGSQTRLTNTDNQETYTHYDLLIHDELLYVPLRQTAEDLGLTVYWDNNTQKAYVISKTGEKVDMTGIIHDNRTFVKTEDFKKLDYRIYYDFDGISKITSIVDKTFDTRG